MWDFCVVLPAESALIVRGEVRKGPYDTLPLPSVRLFYVPNSKIFILSLSIYLCSTIKKKITDFL